MGVARFIDLSKCVKNNKIFDVFKLMIPSDDINSTFSHWSLSEKCILNNKV